MTGLLNYKALPRRTYILLSLLVIGIFIFRVVQTWHYKNTYGSVDLRNRIVGSRIISHQKGVSPYFYKWEKTDGENYIDIYDTPDISVNRNTVTPFVLQLLQPVSNFKFQHIASGWYIAEVAALMLIVLLIASILKEWQHRFYVLFSSLIIIGCSQGWLLHNINGQVYIFYALLLTILFYYFNNNRGLSDILCGLILTIFILMRPIAIVFLFPFLLKRKWKAIGFFFLFTTLYFIQQYINHELWLWKDYASAIKQWALEFFNQHQVNDYIDIYKVKNIEGSSAVAPSPYQSLAEDSSLRGLVFRFLHIKLLEEWLVLITGLAYAVLLFIYRKKIKAFDAKSLFVFSFLLYFITEICLPAVRNSYNYVQWVFPLAIIFTSIKILPKIVWVTLFATIMALGFLKFLPFDLTIPELIFAAISFYFINRTKTANA